MCLTKYSQSPNSDNAGNISSTMHKSDVSLNVGNNTKRLLFEIHVRCIVCVVSLAVCGLLRDEHEHFNRTLYFIQDIRFIVKERDNYESTQKQIFITVGCSLNDYLAFLSSALKMIRVSRRSRSVSK